MDEPFAPQLTPAARRRAARRRWAARGAAVLVLAMALAYAALPWWLPTEWVRRRLESDLTSQLGSPVQIGRLQVGWHSGVVLDDLSVADNRSGQSSRLAHVGQIRCELAPITLLTGRKVRELQIVDPEVWLEIDATGKLKVGDLDLGRGGQLPSLNYAVEGLTCHVSTPEVSQTFRLDRLDLQLDPRTGLLHLSSATRVDRPAPQTGEPRTGRLDVDANLRVPRLKKTEQLSGQIRVEWSNLALNDLPVPIISRVPVEQVSGTSSGRLTFETHPDLSVDYSVAVALNRVRIMRPDLHRPALVPDAKLQCEGRWEPTENTLVMKRLLYDTPGLRIETARDSVPALRFEKHGDTGFEVHVTGHVKNWDELQQEIPEVDQLTRVLQTDPSGQARFTVDFVRARRDDRMRIDIDAKPTQSVFGRDDRPYLRAETDTTKTIIAELVHDRHAGRISLEKLSATLGDSTFELTGEAAAEPALGNAAGPIERAIAVLPTLRLNAKVASRDAQQLRRVLPCLDRYAGLERLTGPVELTAGIDPEGRCSRVYATALLPAESSLSWGDLIAKGPGVPLRMQAEFRLPWTNAGRLSLAVAELQYGQARAELVTGRTGFEYRLGFQEHARTGRLECAGAEAAWNFDVRIGSLQGLIALSPRARRLQAEHQISQAFGDCEIKCRSHLSYRPGDTIVHSEARLRADELALQWERHLSKTAGVPLDIDLSYNWRQVGQQQEHLLSTAIRRPSGEVTGVVLIAPDATGESGHAVQFATNAHINDITDWLAISPRLVQKLGHRRPTGDVSVIMHALSVDDWHSGRLAIDATRVDYDAENIRGFHKPAGLPATAEIAWHGEKRTNMPGQRWTLDEGRLRFGDLAIDRLTGEIATGPLSLDALDLTTFANAIQARLEASGTVTIGDALKAVHPSVRDCIDRMQLAGNANWRMSTHVSPAALSMEGHVDASAASFALDLHDGVLHAIRKNAADAASASWSIALSNWLRAGPRELLVHEARVDVLGSSLSSRGQLTLDGSATAGNEIPQASLTTTLKVPDAAQLLKLLPRSPVPTLRGAVDATVTVDSSKGSFDIVSGQLALDGFEVGSKSRPLKLQGSAAIDPHRLVCDQLDWRLGQSAGTLSLGITPRDAGYAVQAGLYADHLFAQDLWECASELQAGFMAQASPERTPPPKAKKDEARPIIDLLRQSQIDADIRVGTVVTPLPLGIRAVLDSSWQQLTLDNGMARLDFACLVDGGQAAGAVVIDLNAAEPTYRLTYTADRIQPGALVRAYLRRTFPGMEATGPLTLIDESIAKLMPAPGESNYEVGKGELIIDGGTVSGRAAPLWVTQFFPQLNLSSFEFTRLHSWFEKSKTGYIHHQMLYQGTQYHVYMIGGSVPDGSFKYEVGVDFLAGLESEYWANSGQGRVPLFTKTGRVQPDGTLLDETVTFVPMTRTLQTLFVSNNPLVTTYYGVRKRVLGQQ